MKPSTRWVFKKHGWRIDRAIHNFFYFVFYMPYIKIALLITRLTTKYLSWLKPLSLVGNVVFQRYHSKVLTTENTQKIFELNQNINVVSNENKKIVPYKYATKIIFQEPEFIVVMDCPCKLAMDAPGDTVNSCIAVGKGLSSFWLEHCQKYNPRKINQDEALDIIKRLRKKGHVTQAFFKVATGGCTGVICNCHPDTCVSLTASRLTKKINPTLEMNAESGYSISISQDRCDLRGNCVSTCPVGALDIKNGKLEYQKNVCIGCELCVEQCPRGALSLYNDPEKLRPLDIDDIVNHAA